MVHSADIEAAKDGAEAPKGKFAKLPGQWRICYSLAFSSPGLTGTSPPSVQTTAGYAVESSSKLWSVYLSESERHDRALAESWKADMDGLLIFVSLPASMTWCQYRA